MSTKEMVMSRISQGMDHFPEVYKHTDIMTSKLFTIDALIEDKLFDTNLSDVEEVIPSSLKDELHPIENLNLFCLSKHQWKSIQ